MEKEKRFKKWLYYLSIGITLIIIYKLLGNFEFIGDSISKFIGVLMPFLIGMLIAYILYIPEKKIEECYKKSSFKFLKRHCRGTSIFTIYLIVAMILFILINVILPPIKSSIADLIGNLPGYYSTLRTVINDLPEEYEVIKTTSSDALNQVSSIDFAEYLSIENISNYIKGVISAASIIFDIFVVLVISVYTLAERNKILNFLKRITSSLFKIDMYNRIAGYFRETNKIFFGFISGQIIDAIVIGIVTTIAMTIMKVKYAALLGTLIGTFNLIPFFGAIVAVAIAIFITICTGGISKAIWLAIIIIILQQIDANIINPKILGDRLSVSPILVIMSVTFGGAYFGVLGMFLAVPVVTIIKIIFGDYLDFLERKKVNYKSIMYTKNIEEENVTKM